MSYFSEESFMPVRALPRPHALKEIVVC